MATNGILLGQSLNNNNQDIDLDKVEIIPANAGEGRCYKIDGYVSYGDNTIKSITPLYSGSITVVWYDSYNYSTIVATQILEIAAGIAFTPKYSPGDRNKTYYAYIFYNIVPKFSLI